MKHGKRFLSPCTAAGHIKIKRQYRSCPACGDSLFAADKALGIEDGYTGGARQVITLAGGSWGFLQSSMMLKRFLGISVSSKTISRICYQSGEEVAAWQQTAVACEELKTAQGDKEFTTDATSVNTKEDGWRMMYIALFSKRKRGASCKPEEWDKRDLPKPERTIAIAAIEKLEDFKHRWQPFRKLLNFEGYRGITALADGAAGLWNAIEEMFYEPEEVIDVYHVLEHVSACGKTLYPKKEEFDSWRNETTLELLRENGYANFMCRLLVLKEYYSCKRPEEEKFLAVCDLEKYLVKQKGRMNYFERLELGRSIGSGQVEGACKSLVGRRLKRSGACWRIANANRMSAVCAILYTEQWESYWKP